MREYAIAVFVLMSAGCSPANQAPVQPGTVTSYGNGVYVLDRNTLDFNGYAVALSKFKGEHPELVCSTDHWRGATVLNCYDNATPAQTVTTP